ncbi:hypothetical protein Mapa_009064 [Marchantia paleacea]|nr:hypothetical protein Mapa_009064 [Marchantia paleacea]
MAFATFILSCSWMVLLEFTESLSPSKLPSGFSVFSTAGWLLCLRPLMSVSPSSTSDAKAVFLLDSAFCLCPFDTPGPGMGSPLTH